MPLAAGMKLTVLLVALCVVGLALMVGATLTLGDMLRSA